jgi:hypothetical protein
MATQALLPSSQMLNGHKCHVQPPIQFDSTGKGSTGEVDNANCVISKADIGGGVGDPMEVDGEKKDHFQQDPVDIIMIKGDLSTRESRSGTRTQMKHPKNPNNLLIPGLFHTQIALYSVM